jgi:hypothetical protein
MTRFTVVPSPLEQRVGQTIVDRLHHVAAASAQLKEQLNSTLADPELAAKSTHLVVDLVAPSGLPFALLCLLVAVFALRELTVRAATRRILAAHDAQTRTNPPQRQHQE